MKLDNLIFTEFVFDFSEDQIFNILGIRSKVVSFEYLAHSAGIEYNRIWEIGSTVPTYLSVARTIDDYPTYVFCLADGSIVHLIRYQDDIRITQISTVR